MEQDIFDQYVEMIQSGWINECKPEKVGDTLLIKMIHSKTAERKELILTPDIVRKSVTFQKFIEETEIKAGEKLSN